MARAIATMSFDDGYKRQNTCVTVSQEGDAFVVALRMKDLTEDGLPLPPRIFDCPLTVRLTLPSPAVSIAYSVNGRDKVAFAFDEGGTRYAYAELLPNTETKIKINTNTK